MLDSRSDLPLSHRRVWLLAGPIMLSNISVPLVGAVDTAVVGHLPDPAAIGAVALGALIFSVVYWGFGFLRMGTTGFIARALGAQDQQALLDTMLRALVIAIGIGVFIIAVSYPIIEVALYLLQGGEQVEALTRDYALIRIWSAPATLSLYVFTGVFIGMHNTWHALLLQLILNITNILLDVLFVIGLDMGVEGVAIATLIAEYFAVCAGIYLLRPAIATALRQIDLKRLIDKEAMGQLFRANRDIFMRTLGVTFAFAWFTAESARLGDVILAANAILMHLQNIMAYALDGFAHAAEALAGSAYGASRRSEFKRAVLLTSIWAAILALLLTLIYWIFGHLILSLFTNIEPVLNTALDYLPWLIISPLLSIWSFQLDGIFIGSGYTAEMRNAMLISVIFYLLLLIILVPLLGNHGLFLGLSLFMLLRAITLGFYYPRILSDLENKRQ